MGRSLADAVREQLSSRIDGALAFLLEEGLNHLHTTPFRDESDPFGYATAATAAMLQNVLNTYESYQVTGDVDQLRNVVIEHNRIAQNNMMGNLNILLEVEKRLDNRETIVSLGSDVLRDYVVMLNELQERFPSAN